MTIEMKIINKIIQNQHSFYKERIDRCNRDIQSYQEKDSKILNPNCIEISEIELIGEFFRQEDYCFTCDFCKKDYRYDYDYGYGCEKKYSEKITGATLCEQCFFNLGTVFKSTDEKEEIALDDEDFPAAVDPTEDYLNYYLTLEWENEK